MYPISIGSQSLGLQRNLRFKLSKTELDIFLPHSAPLSEFPTSVNSLPSAKPHAWMLKAESCKKKVKCHFLQEALLDHFHPPVG